MSELQATGGDLVPVPVPEPDVIVLLRRGLADADRHAELLYETGDLRGLLVGLQATDRLLGDMRQLRERAAHYAGSLMPKRLVVEPGLPAAERSHPTQTTWEPGVLGELAELALVDRETGEVRSAWEAVGELARLVALCGTVSWRKGGRAGSVGLRDVGVDPDGFCDTVKSNRWHIRFHGGGGR